VNTCIFAYGQTGSGKTYSIAGGDQFNSRGIIPRALSLVFEKISSPNQDNHTSRARVFISFLEIYNEVYFLLL